eukprot:s1359_g1.t1
MADCLGTTSVQPAPSFPEVRRRKLPASFASDFAGPAPAAESSRGKRAKRTTAVVEEDCALPPDPVPKRQRAAGSGDVLEETAVETTGYFFKGFYGYDVLPLNASDVAVDDWEDPLNPGSIDLALSCPCRCESGGCPSNGCQFTLRFAAIPAVRRVIFKCHSCSEVLAKDRTGEERDRWVPPDSRYIVVEGSRLHHVTIVGPSPQATEDCASLSPSDEHPECIHLEGSCQDLWPADDQFSVIQICPFTCGMCAYPSPTPFPDTTEPPTDAPTSSETTTATATSTTSSGEVPETTPPPDGRERIQIEQRSHPPRLDCWIRTPLAANFTSFGPCLDTDAHSEGLHLSPFDVTADFWYEDHRPAGLA